MSFRSPSPRSAAAPDGEDPASASSADDPLPARPTSPVASASAERTYRLCRLDRDGGIASTEALLAPNDRAALALIRKIASGHGLELRHGPRWVGCAPAKPSKADSSR